jgi:hypothetical protein
MGNLSTAFTNAAPQLTANLIDNATGLASNIITNKQNAKNQQKQNEFNLRMWHLNNQYNTPSAQMQRLQQAGLNPNLMYQNGTTGISQGATSSASGSAMQAFQPDFSSGVDSILSHQLAKQLNDANVHKIESEREGQDIENAHRKFELNNKEEEYLRNKEEQNKRIDLLKTQIDDLGASIKLKDSQIDINYVTADKLKAEYNEFIELRDKRVREIESRIGVNEAQASSLLATAWLVSEQAKWQKIRNSHADDYMCAEIAKMNQEAFKYFSERDKNMFEIFSMCMRNPALLENNEYLFTMLRQYGITLPEFYLWTARVRETMQTIGAVDMYETSPEKTVQPVNKPKQKAKTKSIKR